MPRALKSDKFFYYKPKKNGFYKNKMLMGVNHSYEGDVNSINLQDLIDFLNQNGINLSNVVIASNFMTSIKVEKSTQGKYTV